MTLKEFRRISKDLDDSVELYINLNDQYSIFSKIKFAMPGKGEIIGGFLDFIPSREDVTVIILDGIHG